MVSNVNTSNKHSAAWRLFHKEYPVFTKNRYYCTVNAQLGGYQRQTMVTYLSGMVQEEFEKMVGDYTIRINSTVNILVELNKLEAPIAFLNSEDAFTIYKDIQEHMDDWINALKNPFLQTTPPPFDDFVYLDELAANIFTLGRDIVYDMANKDKIKPLVPNRWFKSSHSDYVFDKKHISKQTELYSLYRKNGVINGY